MKGAFVLCISRCHFLWSALYTLKTHFVSYQFKSLVYQQIKLKKRNLHPQIHLHHNPDLRFRLLTPTSYLKQRQQYKKLCSIYFLAIWLGLQLFLTIDSINNFHPLTSLQSGILQINCFPHKLNMLNAIREMQLKQPNEVEFTWKIYEWLNEMKI